LAGRNGTMKKKPCPAGAIGEVLIEKKKYGWIRAKSIKTMWKFHH
jgi:hypothetical protein